MNIIIPFAPHLGRGYFLFAYINKKYYLCTARDREWLRLRLPVNFICIIQVNALPLQYNNKRKGYGKHQ